MSKSYAKQGTRGYMSPLIAFIKKNCVTYHGF